MKINTVNVVEYDDDNLTGIHSFDETPEGNKEAEAHFTAILKEHGSRLSNADIDSYIEDGYWEQGNYQLFISHSS